MSEMAPSSLHPLELAGDQPWAPGFWRRLADSVFGYDFFISYTWSDGRAYAKALAQSLEAYGFECFLDSDDYAKGDDWTRVGHWTLRRTSRLVLVGSPNVHQSRPVLRELRIFRGYDRQVIPISFDGTLDPDKRASPLFEFLDAPVLRIDETSENLASGPSEGVVNDLRNTFNLMRQSEKRVFIFGFAAVVLALAFIGAVWFWNEARNQRERAEQELSQSYARQASSFLEARRHGAAQALLAQARAVATSPLSDLVGYMVPDPMFRPVQRFQLPVGSVDQVWADSDGRFVAVRSSETAQVTIFDRSGTTPRQLFQVPREQSDPVFALVGGATPSVIFLERPDDMSIALGSPERSVLKVRRLDSGLEITHPVETGVGYTSFAKLSDGRYYFANGPKVFALDVTGDTKLASVSTSLSGHINRAVTSDGAGCLMLSDTSGRFELVFADGRANIIWESSQFLKGVEKGNVQHPQGIADADCHHAALWFDGGEGGRIHLATILDAEGKLAPQLVQSFDADTGDNIRFANRFFADLTKQLVFRRGGKWFVHKTGTGALTKTLNAEMPASSGTLYAKGKGLLVSGFGDVLEYHPLDSPDGVERLEVGPQARTVSGRSGEDRKDWLVSVSVDGLLSFWRPEPFASRYQSFPKPILRPEVILAVSPSGDWVGYIDPSRTPSPFLLAASADGQRFEADLDCRGLVSAAVFDTPLGLDVFAGGDGGRLCRFGFTRDGRQVEKDEILTPVEGRVDLLRNGPGNRLLAGNMESGEIYLGSTESWQALARVAMPPRVAGNAITQVEWIPRNGGLVIFDKNRVDFLLQSEVVSQPAPNDCPRLVGVTRDGDALLVCRRGDRNVLIAIGQNGRRVPIQTPDSINALGAALTPDGSTLVAPMWDSDNWGRKVFGKILGHPEGFVFDPSLMDELIAMNQSNANRTNKLPRIERFLFSSDGNKLFAEVALDVFNSRYFSLGSLDRLEVGQTRARVGLAASPGDGLGMFEYSAASAKASESATAVAPSAH